MIELIPVHSKKIIADTTRDSDGIGDVTCKLIRNAKIELKDGDITVLSSKIVSMLQSRSYKLANVRPMNTSSKLEELVKREAQTIIGAAEGFYASVRDEGLVANAAIDESNVQRGTVALAPFEPFRTADEILWAVSLCSGHRIGVILVDSHVAPLRRGTTGVAVSYSGIRGIVDERGARDIYGKKLKHTFRAAADNVASAAELLIGESNQLIPLVIVRGLTGLVEGRPHNPREATMHPQECLYLRNILCKKTDDETDLLALLNGRTHLI